MPKPTTKYPAYILPAAKHLAAAIIIAAGIAEAALPQPAMAAEPSVASTATLAPETKALHVLNRLGYGPRPGDVQRVAAMGVERYIDQQLHPAGIPEPDTLKREIASYETLRMQPVDLFHTYGPMRRGQFGKPTPEDLKARREEARIIVEQAVEARLHRALESPRQLQEVMVDFWFNHFNVFAGKGLDHLWVGAYEEEAIRPHALGRFRDLLEATARHPAMEFYLDNWENTAPGSPGARGDKDGLNENYARELMELHTLGVDGGYTQADVISLARILTGWGIGGGGRFGRNNPQDHNDGGFVFDPNRHDFSTKQFLGRTIGGRGMAEGEEALDVLARSPVTAKHLSFQLAQYFVADQPDPALVDRLSKRWLETDGNISEILRTLFSSPEFWSPKVVGAKFKTPYQFVVSAVRASGIEVRNVRPMVGMLAQLGQPLYGCQTPDGYKNTREAWLSPDAMTRRLSFATAIGSGRVPFGRPEPENMRVNVKKPEAMARMAPDEANNDRPGDPVDPGPLMASYKAVLSPQTKAAYGVAAPQLRAATLLGSPEFMQQ
ncbi:MAG TPA: DUF1800 domain-containing protein [Candidatus Cybelea sp.]|nr:DUF1800 domain-containing protein [Candidatus Cybelea sp.]